MEVPHTTPSNRERDSTLIGVGLTRNLLYYAQGGSNQPDLLSEMKKNYEEESRVPTATRCSKRKSLKLEIDRGI